MEPMNPAIKKDILDVLNTALQGIERCDSVLLKKASDQIIHTASIFQSEESIVTAVLVYAISKLIERNQCTEQIKKLLSNAREEVVKENIERYNIQAHEILQEISKVDEMVKKYVQRVVEFAQIKKGSRIYEHGISLAKTAEILGITQWELMGYIGKTNIHEFTIEKHNVKSRIALAKKIFDIQ